MTTGGKSYYESSFGNYVMVDNNGNPIAVFNNNSSVNFAALVGTKQSVTGVVQSLLWDTKIPVETYYSSSPVFQASSNFNAVLQTYTPNVESSSIATNQDFLVQIAGLPLGNLQSVTATWSFSLSPTPSTASLSLSALAFSDFILSNKGTQFGIMSLFTGLNLLTNSGLDPDGATYSQTYGSPFFDAYFLGYQDYINVYGSRVTPSGDTGTINTLTTVPPGNATLNSIL